MHRKPYNLDDIERIKVGGKNPPSATKFVNKSSDSFDGIGIFFIFLDKEKNMICSKIRSKNPLVFKRQKAWFYWRIFSQPLSDALNRKCKAITKTAPGLYCAKIGVVF